MQTVIPANITARPEVSTASTIAVLDALAALQALAVARDDEERVVDADAEADQQRELALNDAMSIRCESSPIVAVPAPSATPAVISGSVAASSDPNTTSSTISAASAPKAGGDTDARPVRRLGDLSLDLHLQAIAGTGLGGVDELLRLAGGELGRQLGQRHVGERHLPGRRDLRSPARAA